MQHISPLIKTKFIALEAAYARLEERQRRLDEEKAALDVLFHRADKDALVEDMVDI